LIGVVLAAKAARRVRAIAALHRATRLRSRAWAQRLLGLGAAGSLPALVMCFAPTVPVHGSLAPFDAARILRHVGPLSRVRPGPGDSQSRRAALCLESIGGGV